MTTLAGQVALVTGAAGGIGRAIARTLHGAGARVALADVDKQALDVVVQEWPDGDVLPVVVDLTDDDDTAALPGRVRAELGGLDVLINNAGVRQILPLLELTPSDWRRTLDVDLTAPFVLSRAAIPSMVEQGRGKIVNIASMAGALAFQNRAAYCTAKAGLIMLTKTITLEYAAKGVWCNAVAPGVVETPMTSSYFRSEQMAASIRANAPMERWAQPDEIAGPVLFLSGPDSDYVNGTTLFADGGWTAGKGY
ncbi:gluconate 5-dehydrogenase [Actinomycetospora sp. NBRC 106375]|uniref:SDR family NAD(P)-dependent oxidoreductase n=1 Tax=Actinomycetospora sp. NBRC 106375 TaxID=3032207 RepID=UPI0024A45C51|nr:SDR family oxidoreductase [Actinomycetospora sp. NBRC 106375]GLZ50273.1 gluconate 5-dehydrogenase [Actinomycetospora sp. NBRC 106375]